MKTLAHPVSPLSRLSRLALLALAPLVVSTTAYAAPNHPGDTGDVGVAGTGDSPRIFQPTAPVRDSAEDPASSKAQPEPWQTRKLALYAHLAPIGGPAGNAGISLEYSPVPVIAVEAGIGMGLSGAQGALTTWLRPLRFGPTAIMLGGGLSTGNYSPYALIGTAGGVENQVAKSVGWFPAYWGNTELAAEWAFTSGFRVRPYAGASRLLNTSGPSGPPGVVQMLDTSNKIVLPFFGVQLGGSFGP